MITVHTSDPGFEEIVRDAVGRGEEVTIVATAHMSAAALLAAAGGEVVRKEIAGRLADAARRFLDPDERGAVTLDGGVYQGHRRADGGVTAVASPGEYYLPYAVYERLRAKAARKAIRPRWRR